MDQQGGGMPYFKMGYIWGPKLENTCGNMSPSKAGVISFACGSEPPVTCCGEQVGRPSVMGASRVEACGHGLPGSDTMP